MQHTPVWTFSWHVCFKTFKVDFSLPYHQSKDFLNAVPMVFSPMKTASLGLFWPASPSADCISQLSLVLKRRQVARLGGASPQVTFLLRAQSRCFVWAQVCQIALQGWDRRPARSLSLLWSIKRAFVLVREYLFGFVSIIGSLHCCGCHFVDTRREALLKITEPC